MNLTTSAILKAIFIGLTGWVIIAANLKILPSEFPGFWLEWPPYHTGISNEGTYVVLFHLIKGVGLLLLALYFRIVFDWIGPRKLKATIWLDRYCKK